MNDKTIDALDAQARKEYEKENGGTFSIFTDADLRLLWKKIVTDPNIPYDDEVYGEMSSRGLLPSQQIPSVVIEFSENSRLKKGSRYDIYEADKIFDTLDKEVAERREGYDKVHFKIEFVWNGKPSVYTGRYDLGDGDGGLINHIEDYFSFYIDNKQHEQWLTEHKGAEEAKLEIESYKEAVYEFVPYLKLHANLIELQQTAQQGLKEAEPEDTVIVDTEDEEKEQLINVVYVEPGKTARTAKIACGLSSLQKAVGGYIEAVYPFDEEVCIVCNEEGKITGMELNRALYDEDGNIAEIIAGPFFVCDCSGENFGSLTDDQIKRYTELFKEPEAFMMIDRRIISMPYDLASERYDDKAYFEAVLQYIDECRYLINKGAYGELPEAPERADFRIEGGVFFDKTPSSADNPAPKNEAVKEVMSDEEFLASLPEDPLEASKLFVAAYGLEKRMFVQDSDNRATMCEFVAGGNGGSLQMKYFTIKSMIKARQMFPGDLKRQFKHLSDTSRRHFSLFGTQEFRDDIELFLSLPWQIKGEDKDMIQALEDIYENINVKAELTQKSTSETGKEKMSYAERQKMLYSKVQNLVMTFRHDPGVISEYLKFAALFNKYSHKNLRLIYAQNPHAVFVESAAFFRNGMPDKTGTPQTNKKILIKKGEKALYIWAPTAQKCVWHPDFRRYFPFATLSDAAKERAQKEKWDVRSAKYYVSVPVFDIGQTNCPPELYPKGLGFVGKDGENVQTAYDALCNYLSNELHCPVNVGDIGRAKSDVRGFYSPQKNAIYISNMLSGDELLSTLIHEAGHAELHKNLNNIHRSTAQSELEADMYSLMLQHKLGVPVTDSRKAHLVEHYNKYIKELEKNLPKGEALDINADCEPFNTVIRRFNEKSPILDDYLQRQPSIKEQYDAIQSSTAQKATLNTEPAQQTSHKSTAGHKQ